MQTSYHRAFGIAVALTQFDKGEKVVLEPIVDNIFQVGPNFGFVWYNIVGDDLLTNTITGEQIERPAGTCTLTSPIPIGEWRMEIPEDMQVLCASPFLNTGMLPLANHMADFKVLSGEQRLMPGNTKLFLGYGSLTVEGKTITGPQQILFKSGAKQITAITNCYGFIVT